MNDLQIFRNDNFGEVRTLIVNDEPYFVAKDVADILGYQNGSRDINIHVEEEDRLKYKISTSGQLREQILINESGLYSLILSSKLPQAKQFKKWVTSEVIPTIRKHGAYMTGETLEQALTSPDFLIQLATKLKEEQEKNLNLQAINSRLEVENEIMQPKAEYFDELVARNLLTNFRDTAKMFQIKQNEFIKFLLDKKYIYRDNKGKLLPYASKNTGLFEIKETLNFKTDFKTTQTLITPLGREHFRVLVAGLKNN
jgi:prophage antirepressor-like protein